MLQVVWDWRGGLIIFIPSGPYGTLGLPEGLSKPCPRPCFGQHILLKPQDGSFFHNAEDLMWTQGELQSQLGPCLAAWAFILLISNSSSSTSVVLLIKVYTWQQISSAKVALLFSKLLLVIMLSIFCMIAEVITYIMYCVFLSVRCRPTVLQFLYG